MALRVSFCLLGLLVMSYALVVFQDILAPPKHWKLLGDAVPHQALPFSIAVHHGKDELLEEKILAVSTPGHREYGRHLSRGELEILLSPAPIKVHAIKSWLNEAGVPSSQSSTEVDWIDVVTTVSQAERIFNTTFGKYIHERNGQTVIRALEYSVPESLHDSIDSVHSITTFPLESALSMGKSADQKSGTTQVEMTGLSSVKYCGKTKISNLSVIVPSCVKEVYKVPHTIEFNSLTNNQIGVFEIGGDYANQTDLARFEKLYTPDVIGQKFSYTSVFGGPQKQSPEGEEAQIDTEWAVSIAHPLPVEIFIVGPNHITSNAEYFADFSHFLRYLTRIPESKLPRVVSFSWLFLENPYGAEQRHEKTLQKLCSLYGQVAARGVSILVASGDAGSIGAYGCNGFPKRNFSGVFPGTCPWVTAVGATTDPGDERAAPLSSGGTSSIFKRPKYQDKAVQEYLDKIGPKQNAGKFNPNGRAVPDIAAFGHSMASVVSGKSLALNGTSFSAPIMAGIIGLLNAERKQHGKPPLGFLNPWIYGGAFKALNDITKGASSSVDCPREKAFWNATEGYDFVTILALTYYILRHAVAGALQIIRN